MKYISTILFIIIFVNNSLGKNIHVGKQQAFKSITQGIQYACIGDTVFVDYIIKKSWFATQFNWYATVVENIGAFKNQNRTESTDDEGQN